MKLTGRLPVGVELGQLMTGGGWGVSLLGEELVEFRGGSQWGGVGGAGGFSSWGGAGAAGGSLLGKPSTTAFNPH